nr:hypothetical protein [Tanacetum cinerariifolium]
MKKDWKLYDRLMRLESGIGWDPSRKKIDASLEWWDEKIKADEDLAKFKGTKLPLDCRLVDEDEEHQEGKGDSDDMNACGDEVPLFPVSSSSKRKKSSGSGRSTKGKTYVTSEFDERLGSVINALSSRITQLICTDIVKITRKPDKNGQRTDRMDVHVGDPQCADWPISRVVQLTEEIKGLKKKSRWRAKIRAKKSV